MLSTNRIYIRKLELSDAEALYELRTRNLKYFQPFEPIRPDAYHTLEGQKEKIEKNLRKWENDSGYSFGIFLASTDQLIGQVNLSHIVRGAWQNASIGYFMDHSMQRKGYTTEAVNLALDFAFNQAGLHRVEAAIMPRNTASIRVVEKVGFLYVGLSKYYLQINGVWEDHHIYAITQETWQEKSLNN